MNSNAIGKKIWIFPDLEMPPAGTSELKAHESIIILNTGDEDAHVKMTLYFDDKDPIADIDCTVKAKRVRCLRTNNPADFGGLDIEQEKQYAIMLESDIPVVAQYGRLETRQANAAFYTVMGYAE